MLRTSRSIDFLTFKALGLTIPEPFLLRANEKAPIASRAT
jgi:hypothetical protein